MSMAGRLAEHYTAWAVEVTKMAQASSLLTAWWRHSVPDRALVESRFTTCPYRKFHPLGLSARIGR
jgi:hypothetical protein